MISPVNAQFIADARHKELEREVRLHQLKRQAGDNKAGLFDPILIWMGGQMIELGGRLQRPHNHAHSSVYKHANISTYC